MYVFIYLSLDLSMYLSIDVLIYRSIVDVLVPLRPCRGIETRNVYVPHMRALARGEAPAREVTLHLTLCFWFYSHKAFLGANIFFCRRFEWREVSISVWQYFSCCSLLPPPPFVPPLKFCVWVCSETDDNFKGNHHQSMHVASQRQLQFFCHCWAATLDWALWNGHVLKFRLKISQNHGPPSPQCFPHSEVNSWNSVMFRWSLRSKEKRWQRRVCFHVSKEGHGSS